MYWPNFKWARFRQGLPTHQYKLVHDAPSQTSSPRKRFPAKPEFGCNASAMLVLTTIILLLMMFAVQCTAWYMYRDIARCRPESFTPLHRVLDVRYETKTIRSGHLADSSAPDRIFREPQSDEVHNAWADITKPATFPISREEVIRLGKDPDVAIKAPESFGWPKDSYLGSVEFTHQLHCLDTLRKNLLHNYHWYWGSRFGFSPNAVWEWHITHCLDIIRQHLMCNADLTVYTYYFPKGQEGMFGDFSVKEKCVDFKQLLDWNKKMRKENADQHVTSAWRELVEHVTEGPAIPDLPLVTNETRFLEVGHGLEVPVKTIAGFEGKEYCLGGAGP